MTEQNQKQLGAVLWSIADTLRGAMDADDFRDYMLAFLFLRYLSDNYEAAAKKELGNEYPDASTQPGVTPLRIWYAANQDDVPDFEKLMRRRVHYVIKPEYLWGSIAEMARTQDGELLNTLQDGFKYIENESFDSAFQGLFSEINLTSEKLGKRYAERNEKLCDIIKKIAEGLSNFSSEGDTLGDAYEYLMTMYASGAGKSGGEFFTPADVSELLTRLGTVGKTEINKVYDPACGSGSLLLKAEKILGRDAVRNGFYGQEINITTYNLCRINMFLHDIGFDKFDIACEDTLTAPQHWDDEPFELIVSNPPYSIKWAGDDDPLLINDPRFAPAGVLAPKSKADLAFIMHSLSWLATGGTAAIVCFPGIMYRGGAERKIRKYLIDNNFIDCIIQLPSNLFFGTSIATCIMVLKKGKADNKTLFIDATGECIKVTNNNKLTPANIDRIVDTFAARAEEAHFSHLASYEEIESNDYNLSVSTYVEAEDTREKIDIVKLNAEIEEIVAREQVLRDEIAKIIAEIEVGV